MELPMISRGVEISIAGGVAETEDVRYRRDFFSLFFYLNHVFICFRLSPIGQS